MKNLNLITMPWLPVIRLSGARAVIAPTQLTTHFDDDPIVALNFSRPDFNAAVSEFLIGLFAVAMPPENKAGWLTVWNTPPDQETLETKFAPLVFAMNLIGEGPCVFQDFDLLDTQKPNPIAGLLINAPGANTVKNYQDFFVKDNSDFSLSQGEAAAALITLQTYAPSGGAGHRTSMRGGGPLTVLARPVRARSGHAYNDESRMTLFDLIWANVPEGAIPALDQYLFAWLGPTPTSESKQIMLPEKYPPQHAFFGMPRRIRLAEPDSKGLIKEYRTQNYGINYEQWVHPLSPYRVDKKAGQLPLHPRNGQPCYQDWPSVLGGDEIIPSKNLTTFFARRVRDRFLPIKDYMKSDHVIAFGYDMDNAKARAWIEIRTPLPGSTVEEFEQQSAQLKAYVTAGHEAARALVYILKAFHFGSINEDGALYTGEAPNGKYAEIGASLMLQTENNLLQRLNEKWQASVTDAQQADFAWLNDLTNAALSIFDKVTEINRAPPDKLRMIVHLRPMLMNMIDKNIRKALPDLPAKKGKTQKLSKKKESSV